MQKQNKPQALEHGKLPPQALELEEAVLGAILLESRAYYLVAPLLKSESFYSDQHQKIWEAIKELDRKRIKIDILTVPEELRVLGYLEEVGGIAYITQLTSRVASAAHIEDHAKIIQQKFIAREVIRISTESQNLGFDESIDISEVLEFLQVNLNNLVRGNVSKIGRMIGTIGGDRIKELVELSKNKTELSGLPCGFSKIDRHTGGWQNSDLVLIAARPSMGKSFIAQRFAINACKSGLRVLFYSLEMTDRQIYDRELSYSIGLENNIIRKAEFDKEEWEEIEKAQGTLENYKLIIDDTPGLTVAQFKAKSLMYRLEHGIDIIFVDYLQLMKSPQFSQNRNLEIGDISANLKSLAKEMDIPIVALSQLSRKTEDRSNKRPQLSDLRESGQLEQDADIVCFIHRPEYYNLKTSEDGGDSKNLIEFIFAKHRNGSTGTIKLWKNTNWTEINDYNKDYDFKPNGDNDTEEIKDLPF